MVQKTSLTPAKAKAAKPKAPKVAAKAATKAPKARKSVQTTEAHISAATCAAIRSGFGLSQEAFAEKLGVAFQTYNAWERGRQAPNAENIVKLTKLQKQLERRKK